MTPWWENKSFDMRSTARQSLNQISGVIVSSLEIRHSVIESWINYIHLIFIIIGIANLSKWLDFGCPQQPQQKVVC